MESKQEDKINVHTATGIIPKAKQVRIIPFTQYQQVAEPETKNQEWAPSIGFSFGSGMTGTKCTEIINDYALMNGLEWCCSQWCNY
jgi:hypothetical protein